MMNAQLAPLAIGAGSATPPIPIQNGFTETTIILFILPLHRIARRTELERENFRTPTRAEHSSLLYLRIALHSCFEPRRMLLTE